VTKLTWVTGGQPQPRPGDQQERARFDAALHRDGKKGSRLIAGGHAPATADGGYFLEPTVIADVARRWVISQEEIFGPVLAIIKVANFEEG